MSLDPLTAIIDAGKTVLNKFVRDKAGEAEIIQIENNFELDMRREAAKEGSSFRDFVIAYEGSAKDMPKIIQILRAVIRPGFTLLIGYFNWLFFSGANSDWGIEKVSLLKAMTLLCLAFYFGERAIKNTGIINLLIHGKTTNGKQT